MILLLEISGCAPAYRIVSATAHRFAPTSNVDILHAEPAKSFIIIASFRGDERSDCPENLPYCSLVEQAQEMGAHAIWVQSKRVYRQYDKWEMIQGKLTKLRGFTIETIQGVFLRYKE